MKKIILSLFVVVFLVTSCSKEETATCTCTDGNGAILGQTSLTTTDKSEIDQFKNDCASSSIETSVTVNGTTTTTATPCQLN